MMRNVMLFAPDESAAGGQTGDKPKGDETSPKTFEEWLGGQAEDVKALYATHTEGLRNTVKATRDERDGLQKQLKDLGKKLDEGSEAKKSLDEISGKLDAANRRADFYEAASKPEIGCNALDLAWLAVQNDAGKFVDGRGNVKFDALKEHYPALFGKPSTPPGHAGAGRDGDNQNLSAKSMDNFIRAAAGKG